MAKRHSTQRKRSAERVDHTIPNTVQLALLRAEQSELARRLAKHGTCQPLWALDEVEVALLRADMRPLAEAFARFRRQLGVDHENPHALCGPEVVWRELSAIARRLRISIKPAQALS
jgi:hypothetical protein